MTISATATMPIADTSKFHGITLAATNTIPATQYQALSDLYHDLHKLQHLDLSHNRLLPSTIPRSYGNLTSQQYLNLYRSGLIGKIPYSIGYLRNLTTLYFDCNDLTGSIPSSLGLLTRLQGFYIDTNLLSGSIPSAMEAMTSLSVVHMNNNMLTDSIPSSLSAWTNNRKSASFIQDTLSLIPVLW